jgi:hypothetical protein
MSFIATYNKGFRMKFDNGFSISVQWGIGNYCEKKNLGATLGDERKEDFWESKTAEVAVFDNNNDMLSIGNEEAVIGWLSPDEVAKVISIISSSPQTITIGKEGHNEIEMKIKSLNL